MAYAGLISKLDGQTRRLQKREYVERTFRNADIQPVRDQRVRVEDGLFGDENQRSGTAQKGVLSRTMNREMIVSVLRGRIAS